ncbi:hypothetical protein BASA81_008700 [Batrachochytrium salamandrivorans]|nr:hypothetical protein BASA81_008700 [Batrachochytrium salamandrivorans]
MRLGLFGRPSRPSVSSPSHHHDQSKASPKPTPSILDSLDKIRDNIVLVNKREAFQNTKIQFQQEEAKQKLALGDNKAALVCLTRKRQLEHNVVQLGLMRTKMEDLIMSIETGMLTLQVQHGMSEGLAAQKRLGVDPDRIAELQSSLEEEMAKIEESTMTLATPLAPVDEAELLRDLAELELEANPPPTSSIVLPMAPTHQPFVYQDYNQEDEQELERLEQEMMAL